MGLIGTLGEVAYDIVANDETGRGLKSAREGFVTTAGDIINAITSVSDKLAAFDEMNSAINTNLEITALTLGMNAEELRELTSSLTGPTDGFLEMSGAVDEVVTAGVRNREEIAATVEGFDLLADAIGKPTDELISDLIPAFKAFGVPVQDASQYADRLAYTFNTTRVSSEEFSNTMRRMGPELAKNGVTIEDVSTMLVLLKEKGYDSRNMMQELTAATSENADTNKDGKVSLDEMLASMGMTQEEFRNTDTSIRENSRNYATNAAQIRNDNLPINEQFRNSQENIVASSGGVGDTLITLGSAFSGIASTISTIAIPAMMLFPEAISTVGTAIAGSFAAALAAGIAVGLASVWVLVQTGVMDWIGGIGKMFSDWAPQWAEDVILVIASPFASVGAAILDIVKGDWDSIGEDMLQPFEWAGEAIGRSVDGIRDSLYGLTDAAYQMGADFGGAVGSVVAGAVAIFSGIGAAFQGMAGQFGGIFQNIVDNVYKIMAGTYEGFVNIGKNIIFSMVNGIMAAGSSILEAIQGIFGQLGSFFGFGGGTASVATRAAGGPVSSGTPYLVGERGPELFTPGSSGEISPTGSFGGSQNITINIMGAEKDPVQIANEVARVLQQTRKQRGMTI